MGSPAPRTRTRSHGRAHRSARCTTRTDTSRASASVCCGGACASRSPAGPWRTCRRTRASASAGTRCDVPGRPAFVDRTRVAPCCDPRSGGHLPGVDFERLYRETYPRVLAYARSVASGENADDAVAETYVIAWRRQRDIPRNAELGWLIGVTRRVLANARRSRRRSGALHALLDMQPRIARARPRRADRGRRAAQRAARPLSAGPRGRAADGLVRPVER